VRLTIGCGGEKLAVVGDLEPEMRLVTTLTTDLRGGNAPVLSGTGPGSAKHCFPYGRFPRT